jgi:hypothetical protein
MKQNPKHIRAMKDGKVPFERVPFGPLAAVARVMASGAFKYGKNNWRIDEILATTYVGAIGRHAFLEWAAGIDKDKDTGEHPLAHVIACCLLVLDAEAHGTLVDDRLLAESINGHTGTIKSVLRALPRQPKGEARARRSKPGKARSRKRR